MLQVACCFDMLPAAVRHVASTCCWCGWGFRFGALLLTVEFNTLILPEGDSWPGQRASTALTVESQLTGVRWLAQSCSHIEVYVLTVLVLSTYLLHLFYVATPRQNVVVYAHISCMRRAAVVERHTPPRTMLWPHPQVRKSKTAVLCTSGVLPKSVNKTGEIQRIFTTVTEAINADWLLHGKTVQIIQITYNSTQMSHDSRSRLLGHWSGQRRILSWPIFDTFCLH